MILAELLQELEKLEVNTNQLLIKRIGEYSDINDVYKSFETVAIQENRDTREVIRTAINIKIQRLNNNNEFKLDTLIDLINFSKLLYVYEQERGNV